MHLFSLLANGPFQPVYDHLIYTSCMDAFVRGGIRPSPGQSISIVLADGNSEDCSMEDLEETGKSCPVGLYGKFPNCFSVHENAVDNTEAAR